MSAGIMLVLTTCADAERAAALAETLVQQRLAACVNAIERVASTYRWQGKIERGTETMLVIKTTAERYPALEDHLRAHSGYELPEIIAVRAADGLAAYLNWVHAETSA